MTTAPRLRAQRISSLLIRSLHEHGLWFTGRENEIELPNVRDEDWSDYIIVAEDGRTIEWSGAYEEPPAKSDRQVDRLELLCSSWRFGVFTLDHLGDQCCWSADIVLKSEPDICRIRELVQWIAIEGELLRRTIHRVVNSDEPVEHLTAEAKAEAMRLLSEHLSASDQAQVVLDNWPGL